MSRAARYNEWLVDRARPYLGQRVLDAGAGTGTLTELLSRDRELVVAVEPEPDFAAALRHRFRERPNVVVVELDAGTLEPERVAYDVDSVVCINVLEHIPDDAGVLRAFAGILPSGGYLLLLVPAHPVLFGSLDRTVGHVRRYRANELRRALIDAGFAAAAVRYVNPVGALGWLVSARLLRREHVPEGSLRLFDRVVPLLRAFDRIPLPFGLSVWAVARKP